MTTPSDQDRAIAEEAVRSLTRTQRKFVKAGCIHGDFRMTTVRALEQKGLFHLVIDSPNGQCGFMRLTPHGEAVQAALQPKAPT